MKNNINEVLVYIDLHPELKTECNKYELAKKLQMVFGRGKTCVDIATGDIVWCDERL